MADPDAQIDQLSVNTIRFLAVDAVERAGSGHPGLPLGAAPMAFAVWDRFLRHNPRNPAWPDRDRFVLSAGHGSMLIYALLHLYGYDLSLDDLRNFRQWGSKTPGHPEVGHTPGIETTTGPLGQGFAAGVGMAIAERFLAATFNRDGFPVIDHATYAIVSDGDLMEGIAAEAASLAGQLGLGKLIYLYDDNHISLAGTTEQIFQEDVSARFQAYGWHVTRVAGGNDVDSIAVAIESARAETARPSLLMVRTHIGYGSPKQDSHAAHGEPLGPDAARATKQALGWPAEPEFHVPDEARAHFARSTAAAASAESSWNDLIARYRTAHPELAGAFERALRGELPPGWDADLPEFSMADGPIATRDASGAVLNALASRHPTLVGGSADLDPSTKTYLQGLGDFSADAPGGRNLHFGVREHAMGGIVMGSALHGGVLPFSATFLVFADYMRPSLRLAALAQAHAIFVFTHDSIALGEDGPTHQPIEHLASLRAIPGLTVIRPADANESREAWRLAVERSGPSVLIFTRQKLPLLDLPATRIGAGVARGAYVVAGADDANPDLLLIASGSEVHLALAARAEFASRDVRVRVVSMPSWELFEEADAAYRQEVFPPSIPKLAIEAAHSMGWHRFVGDRGDVIGLERFGASAPGDEVYANLGFNVENVVLRGLGLMEIL